MQYHFLVVFDTETGKWVRDDETLEVMVSGGPIYDEAVEDWRAPKDEKEAELDRALAEELDERLGS
jgi:hypothetical protein